MAAVLGLAAAAGPAAAAGDPAAVALAGRDVYVSPRVLGTAAPAAEATLRDVVLTLGRQGRPVKAALVVGPAGAPSLQAYSRRLARTLGFDGTLVVTRRTGAVATVGPRSTAEATLRLRSAGVGRILNPVDRLGRAARLVAVPLPEAGGASWRPALALLALGLLGGGWAVAIGSGQASRRERRHLAERRIHARVRLDALRAHAIGLARLPGLPDLERPHVEAVLGSYAEIVAAAAEARTPGSVAALDQRIDAGLVALTAVAARVGAPHPHGRIFGGLCAVDPAHGWATASAHVDGVGAPVCAGCLGAEAGAPLTSRRVPAGAGWASFATIDEMPQGGGGPDR